MAPILYSHPLASYCHKVLLALHENETPFEARRVDLLDDGEREFFRSLWPLGKIPVLRDEARMRTVAETSIIIEYLEQYYPGRSPLLPRDGTQALEARFWDRFFDLHVSTPLQKIVADRLRPDGARDAYGVDEAVATLRTAYDMIERQMIGRCWAIGDDFSIADCAAAPALFYANIIVPYSSSHANLAAYFRRLEDRPSFRRVIEEARPWFHRFPFHEALPPAYRPPGE